MQADGWWWADASTTNKAIRRGILREILAHRFAWTRRGALLGPAQQRS